METVTSTSQFQTATRAYHTNNPNFKWNNIFYGTIPMQFCFLFIPSHNYTRSNNLSAFKFEHVNFPASSVFVNISIVRLEFSLSLSAISPTAFSYPAWGLCRSLFDGDRKSLVGVLNFLLQALEVLVKGVHFFFKGLASGRTSGCKNLSPKYGF